MGNQAIKNDFRKVLDPDFEDTQLDPYMSKLFTFQDIDSLNYSNISSNIVDISDHYLNKQFPTTTRIEAWELTGD